MSNTLDIKLIMADDGSIQNIQAKLKDGFKKIADDADESAKKTKSSWQSVSAAIKDNEEAFKKIGTGFAVIGGGITAFMGVASHAAGESQLSTLKLQQSIRLAGLEMETTSKTVQDFATNMQNLTGVSDELVTDFVGRMIPITGDLSKALDITRLSMDFAAQTGKDLNSVEQIMTQVLAGNIETLRRAVPALKNYTNEELDSMTASQRTALALEALRKQFGGMAEVEGKSAIGQMRILHQTINDLMETIGARLLPGIISMVQSFQKIVLSVNEWAKSHQFLSSVMIQGATVLGVFMLALAPVLLAIPTLSTSINVALIPAFRALFAVISAHPIGALAVAISGLIAAGVQLTSMWINQREENNKAISTTKEMIQHHREEADEIRKAIATRREHIEINGRYYQSAEELTARYLQLQKAIRFQEKQLLDQTAEDKKAELDEDTRRRQRHAAQREELMTSIFAREKLLADSALQDRIARLDVQHETELRKLQEFGARSEEIKRVLMFQELERQAAINQVVTEKAESQRQIIYDVDQGIANSKKESVNKQLAVESLKYQKLQQDLLKWHNTQTQLDRLQNKSTEEDDKKFFAKSRELTKAEEDAKNKIKREAQKAALSDLVSNLQELSKHSAQAFEFFKAISIAQTIISTYEGATKAYAAMAAIPFVGPALGAAAAAVAIAAGLSRVAAISSQQRPTFHTGGEIPGVGDVPITAQSGEFIVRRDVAQQNLPLLTAINNGQSVPQTVMVNIYHYGDIRTEADKDQFYKELGQRIRDVVRSGA